MQQTLFDSLPAQVQPYLLKGRVADYIPALSHISQNKFGIAATTVSGECYKAGDSEENFSLQSITKVFALLVAVITIGDNVWESIGRRLTTKAFNSISPLEEAGGTPRNPFTNAGALAIVDQLLVKNPNYPQQLLSYIRQFANNSSIDFDPEVASSEKETGYRNIAIAHLLKGYGLLQNSVDAVLDAYYLQCSLAMCCVDLSRSLLFLANKGSNPSFGEQVISPLQCRRINALMMMFGTYDGAGEFVFRIGLPGKSGVGGGLVAIVPGKMSLAVWSPSIDASGTSIAGLRALEIITQQEDLAIL